MTRQVHDQFAKQFLEEFLSTFGVVEISREIPGEVYQADIWFSPFPQPPASPELGLLGRIASNPCLLEPYRNQPSLTEIRSCLLKLFSLQNDLQRKARRESNSLAEESLPYLWILAPSASENLLNNFGFILELETWGEGVYVLEPGFKTGIIAINQLPVTSDTLWLRLLGKGRTQQQAIDEILALPGENLLRGRALEQLTTWRINLNLKDSLTEEERELLMALSAAYQQWREDTLQQGVQQGVQQGIQQGVQQGIQQGQRLVIENVLKARFGALDEELLAVVSSLLQLSPEEYGQALLQLSNLSRDELISQFSEQ